MVISDNEYDIKEETKTNLNYSPEERGERTKEQKNGYPLTEQLK